MSESQMIHELKQKSIKLERRTPSRQDWARFETFKQRLRRQNQTVDYEREIKRYCDKHGL